MSSVMESKGTCTVSRNAVLGWLCVILAVFSTLSLFIARPLWLDSLKPEFYGSFSLGQHNTSNVSSQWKRAAIVRQISPYFACLSQSLFSAIVFGTAMLFVKLFFPSQFGSTERNYPKSTIFFQGFAQTFSLVVLNYAISGTRTAPYLQAILFNFNIPIQIVVRFLVLHKRPTLKKVVCAAVVVSAELLCLLPTMVPGLENAQARKEEGGAIGVGKLLWPLGLVISRVPFSLVASLMEHSVKDDTLNKTKEPLNMLYYLALFSWFHFLSVLVFFWVDIIPGFGTTPSMGLFIESLAFNFGCLFGGNGCGPHIYLYGWDVLVSKCFTILLQAYTLRFTEGANFYTLALTLRSPLLFLFWTLFNEHPFYWHPHAHLSTWLSIVGLVVMIPAVIMYQFGAKEHSKSDEKVERYELLTQGDSGDED